MAENKRVVVEDLADAPRLKAREIEVSDFRRPAAPINPVQGQSQLGQLVNALGDFNAQLRQFNNIYMAKSNTEAEQAGIVDFYKNPDKYREAAKGGVAEMVRKGLVDPSQNPYRAVTILEITGQDLAEGKYQTKLFETLSKAADLSADQVDQHISTVRSEFVKQDVGDSFYTNLGFSKRANNVEREFRKQVLNVRGDRQNAIATEKLSSMSMRLFDDMMHGDLNDDAFVTDSVARFQGLLKEAQLGTLTKDPNATVLSVLKAWVQNNTAEHPEDVQNIVSKIGEIDPRGDGNQLKNLRATDFSEINEWIDNNANRLEERALKKMQITRQSVEQGAQEFARTWKANRLMETGESELQPDDKRQLLEELKKQPFYSKSPGIATDVVFGENGIASEKSTVGEASKSDETFDKARFERATSDPLLAPKALEDLRALRDAGVVVASDFARLEPKLQEVAKNKDLTEKSESFTFNKNSLTDLVTTRLAVDPNSLEDVKRKADLVDEASRMYREAVSLRLIAERNTNPNEPFDAFQSRMVNSPIYAEVRNDVQKSVESKIKAEEVRIERQQQIIRDMESKKEIGKPGFFDKIFKSNTQLIGMYKDASSAISKAIVKNPALDTPENRSVLQSYYAEIKSMAEEDLSTLGQAVVQGGYYVPNILKTEPGSSEMLGATVKMITTPMWKRQTSAFGFLPGMPNAEAMSVNPKTYKGPVTFVPYPPEKAEEAKKAFVTKLTQVGTSWTNFVDSETGLPRENVRVNGVLLDPAVDVNGLELPLFSSRDEFNDVFSRPELAKSLADALKVDVNQFRINQAVRLIERGL